MTRALQGQHILVTRPAHQAGPLCQLLGDAGATTSRMPLLEIREQDDAQSQQRLKDQFINLDHYSQVIFISANAARIGCQWIDRYWPQLPQGINWLAVGDATARELQQQHLITAASATGMDSESLLSLPQLQQLEHQRILICRGVGGRELLAETLIQRGAKVDYAELYSRVDCSYSTEQLQQQLISETPSAILISSGQSLENLHHQADCLLPKALLAQHLATLIIVPSHRVAELARQLGYQQIRIASHATDQAMLAALEAAPLYSTTVNDDGKRP